MMSAADKDIKKAASILLLAQSFYGYGQHARVLSLLDLYDWFLPGQLASRELRIRCLVKMKEFKAALGLLQGDQDVINGDLVAEVLWGLGDKRQGDEVFRDRPGAVC